MRRAATTGWGGVRLLIVRAVSHRSAHRLAGRKARHDTSTSRRRSASRGQSHRPTHRDQVACGGPRSVSSWHAPRAALTTPFAGSLENAADERSDECPIRNGRAMGKIDSMTRCGSRTVPDRRPRTNRGWAGCDLHLRARKAHPRIKGHGKYAPPRHDQHRTEAATPPLARRWASREGSDFCGS